MKKDFLSKLKILLLVCGAYYLVTWFTGCPVKYFTGISCPGCGMTRAWLAALQLDFTRAFACHPLFPTVPFLVLAFLFSDRIDWRKYRWIWILLGALFLLVYLVRMIWFPSDIVSFEPENGLILRIFKNILNLL